MLIPTRFLLAMYDKAYIFAIKEVVKINEKKCSQILKWVKSVNRKFTKMKI